ncbi:LpqB family beta-propeller domain-containing protein [Corynebacterium liangguodongii]|uniref:LpqB family beta-propeller domain-containing protein n=1 Tax=Corynebacterium liangguodongii TaxID=2079535 RepID=UPI001F338E23|nr:LpqB family beta-propeller domain-containing protein [Corynebacterium liangguodongii]
MLVAAAVAAGLVMGSCAALPTDSEPEVIRRFDAPTQASPDIRPEPNSDPDMLLRDFFAASAVPAANYEGARSFLTEQARQAWDPSTSTIVVDRISINTLAGGGETQSFNVQGNVVGELLPGGAFVPTRQGYEATMELERVDGQWRISSLPPGTVIERSEMRNRYQPYNVFYYARGAREIVPDRRWVHAGRDSLETAVISLLLAGPSTRLRDVVDFEIPPEAAYTGVQDGAYAFTGLSKLSENQRVRFASQLVWTLSSIGINRPVAITADGDPLVPGVETFSREDFADANPQASHAAEDNLYTLANQSLFKVDDGKAEPLDGQLAEQGSIASADIGAGGNYAVVTGKDGEQVLKIGEFDKGSTEVARAKNFTRPAYERGKAGVWVVADGKRVVRFTRAATGEFASSDVAVDMPDGVDGSISVLRLSPTGVRAVMVVEGTLYTGIVEQDQGGQRRITNVLEYAPDLAGNVIAADWQADGSIVVGTSNPGSPVVRVEQDGSGTTGKPIGNITAPVVAVAAGAGMVYATDANAVLQMPDSADGAAEATNWREVPGLQGVRSVPIVAR